MKVAATGNESPMRALVTNDDGVRSEGLLSLAWAAASHGLEVTVAAPAFDASGSSASMTATASDGKVLVDTVSLDGPVTVLGVQGPPAFIVRAAMYGAFGAAPDVVLSGVNRGLNTGRAVLHSGTVGAALTAANYGRSGLAISAEAEDEDDLGPPSELLASAVDWILRAPRATVLNVNVPRSRGGRLDVRHTTLARCGVVQGSVSEVTRGFVPVTFADDDERDPAGGTDSAALANGFVSVTPICAVTENDGLDMASLLAPAGEEL